MKIAVAAEGERVSEHFGHCDHFVLADIIDGRVQDTIAVPNPGHEPGALPPFVASLGAELVIAGGMGSRAVQLFEANGVRSIVGVHGTARDAIAAFAAGTLEAGESGCTEEHAHEGCR
jgi:predicted Fe-Mo cluster-binding NifX family protein